MLQLSDNPEECYCNIAMPWQEDDFAALDPAWQSLAGQNIDAPIRRAYIERPRGHSKTSDMAIQILWVLLYASTSVSGIAAAADRDQAALIWEAAQRIAKLNHSICKALDFRKNIIINKETGSQLEIISSDVNSSWGQLPDFVICDELCHWEKPDIWFSLLSSAAKRPKCLLTVLTNAGVGRDWQWDVREAARNSSQWYFSSLSGTQAPWITEETLNEQRDLLPKPIFERLWQNIWQHSDGEFVSLAEAEACRDINLKKEDRGEPNQHYIAAIDYAEKHDYTAAVLLHHDGTRIVIDRMDVIVPQSDSPVPVQWVEDWMTNVAKNFQNITFIIDEYQLLGTIQKLSSKYKIQRFDFGAGKGNHALAVNLRRLIIHREIAWYKGCGQLESTTERDDLETELASLLLKQSASGRVRIDHLKSKQHHDDRAFVVGAAALHLVTTKPSQEWLQITESPTGNFGW